MDDGALERCHQVKWPNDANIAVCFVVAWETWPSELGTRSSIQPTNRRPLPEEALYHRDEFSIYDHAFAETGGLQRILDVFARHEIRGCFQVTGATLVLYPELLATVVEAGHEVAIQTWEHEYLPTLDAEAMERSVGSSVRAYEEAVGASPEGFVPPGGLMAPGLLDILARYNITWLGGFRNTDVPFVISARQAPHVAMPDSMLSDYDSYNTTGLPPRLVMKTMRDEFDELYREGLAGKRSMLSYTVIPFLARAFRTRPLEDFIRYVKEKEGVWIASRNRIAKWLLTSDQVSTLDELYPGSADFSDLRYELQLGLAGPK